MSAVEIVNKVWNYAHVLRDDGVGYGDYVEQITYLIFLKMADERDKAGQKVRVPNKYAWSKLVKHDGDDLELQYRHTLESLGKQGGMLGTIFRKAQNKIQDPAKLKRLIKMIDKEQWSTLPADAKGDIYEGLLERNAQDVKGSTGQYFTPRPIIQAMVGVMKSRLRLLAVSCLMVSCSVTFAADSNGTGIKTPLLGITAVADEESTVVEPESAPGGALEMNRYFATHLLAELVECGKSVSTVFNEWLKDHSLIPVKQTSAPDRYFMRAWDLDKRGIFEGSYQVNNKMESTRVSLDFFNISGKKLLIQDVNRMQTRYQLSDLWESLAEAMECDP